MGLGFEGERASRAIPRARPATAGPSAIAKIVATTQLPDAGFAVTPANVVALVATIRAERPGVLDGRKRAVKLLLKAQGVDLTSGAGQSLLSREWIRIRDLPAPPSADEASRTRTAEPMPDTRLLKFEWLPVLPKFLLTALPAKVRQLQLPPEHEATALSVGPYVARFADEVVASFPREFVEALRAAAAAHLRELADATLLSLNRPRVPAPPLAPLMLKDLGLQPLFLGLVPALFSVRDVAAIGGPALVVRGRSGWVALQLGLAVECAALARVYLVLTTDGRVPGNMAGANPERAVATVADAVPAGPRPLLVDAELRRALRRYRKILPRIHANDVRFKLRSSRVPLDRLVSGEFAASAVAANALRILQRQGLSLGTSQASEVASALRLVLTERSAKVLIGRLGLEAGKVQTLEEVGRELEVTRERVRQIEKKALKVAKGHSAYLPLCAAAIRGLRRLGGTAAEDELCAAVGTAKLPASAADLRALIAVGVLDWGPKVTEDSGYWSLTPGGLAQVRIIRDAIRDAARTEFGAAFSLAEVVETLLAAGARADVSLVRAVARRLPDLADLGDDVFARRPGKDSVGRMLSKILQTAGPMGEGLLTRAFLRDPRLKRIPREVIARELRSNPVFAADGGKWSVSESVSQIPPYHAEQVALAILRADGAMTGPELYAALRKEGIGEASASGVISQSPLIQKWPRNVYTQIGARPTAGEIADAVERRADRRANRPKRPIDIAHLSDGSIKITTAYGAGLLASGVLSLGNRVHLNGDWEGQADGAYRHRVRSANGLVWGIGPWIRQQQLADGDYLSLTFKPQRRTVWLQRESAPDRA